MDRRLGEGRRGVKACPAASLNRLLKEGWTGVRSSRACASLRGPEQLSTAERPNSFLPQSGRTALTQRSQRTARELQRTAKEDCKRGLQKRTAKRTAKEDCKRELERGTARELQERTGSVRKREARIGGMNRGCRVHNHSAHIVDDPDLGDTIGASRRHQPRHPGETILHGPLQFSCSSLRPLR